MRVVHRTRRGPARQQSMFPFFVARTPDDGRAVVVAHEPRYVAAFTSLAGGRSFMQQIGQMGWRFKLIGRANFYELRRELQVCGRLGLYLEPGEGVGGRLVSFDDLEALAAV